MEAYTINIIVQVLGGVLIKDYEMYIQKKN